MPVTVKVLQKRLNQIEAGNFCPQLFLAFTVNLGAFLFGNVLGWSCPANKHLIELKVEDYDKAYSWTVSIAPLGAALGILPSAFFARRLGPRKTLIIQSPINVGFWLVLTLSQDLITYNVARFFISFCSITYCYCGEKLLNDSVHRRYLKVMYALHRASPFLGVLTMNALGPILERHYLCLFCTGVVLLNCFCLKWLPESPVYLMRNNPLGAKKSLRWYRGSKFQRVELDVITQYVNFLKNPTTGFISMLQTKVVVKVMIICATLFSMKGMSGYYAFLIDNPKWFTKEYSCFSPYIDNITLSAAMTVARFISTTIFLYGPFGIRKPLLISSFGTSILLAILGYYKYILKNIMNDKKDKCVTLPTLCLYTLAYECGLSICPEIALYEYLPFQIYLTVKLCMESMQMLMIFIITRIYMITMMNSNFYLTLWMLAGNMFVGYVFVMLFVIESKGLQLLQIQIQLGGNPIGTRGSRRQRIATPMDNINTNADIREIINNNYKEQS